MEITSCLQTVRQFRAEFLYGGHGGGAQGRILLLCKKVDSHFCPNSCQHILQMSSVPAVVALLRGGGVFTSGWVGWRVEGSW